MNGYPLALFIHFLSLLVACATASLAMLAALRMRGAAHAEEVLRWINFVRRIVRAFPVAVLGLVGSGVYMVRSGWGWSQPWVQAAVVGLVLIVILGSGVEGQRGRVLWRELEAAGLSPRALRLLRDPLAWSAKMTTLTLVVAVVFVMTAKPGPEGSVAALAAGVLTGVAGAVPFWKEGGVRAPASAGHLDTQVAP